METQRFAPGLLDRLLDDHVQSLPATWTLDHLKDAVARDLESLLNTRAALPEYLFTALPEASKSVLTYGLTDFAGMCMSSDADRKKICATVLLTIERHEPRLQGVTASLRQRSGQINRFDFLICGKLRAEHASNLLQFDAVLEPATQQYSIRKT